MRSHGEHNVPKQLKGDRAPAQAARTCPGGSTDLGELSRARAALIPFSRPPTSLGWQTLGFHCESQTHGGGGVGYQTPKDPTSLPEQGLFQVPWGKGWAVAYGLEPANEQTWALVTAQPEAADLTWATFSF